MFEWRRRHDDGGSAAAAQWKRVVTRHGHTMEMIITNDLLSISSSSSLTIVEAALEPVVNLRLCVGPSPCVMGLYKKG